MQEIDPFEMADIMNDDRAIEEVLEEQELNQEADIIMQSVDPAVMNAWEEEIVNPSPLGAQDDDGPPIIL